jgi:hypothetical protein
MKSGGGQGRRSRWRTRASPKNGLDFFFDGVLSNCLKPRSWSRLQGQFLFYRDCRKTLPVVRPGATSLGWRQVFRHFHFIGFQEVLRMLQTEKAFDAIAEMVPSSSMLCRDHKHLSARVDLRPLRIKVRSTYGQSSSPCRFFCPSYGCRHL